MSDISEFSEGVDVVFLATAHEVSHDLAPQFLAAGCVVIDLSGAFRVNDPAFYERYYGFTHQHPELLEKAVYGLAEWQGAKLKESNLIAVPGCYPTASQLALKPLIDAGLAGFEPVAGDQRHQRRQRCRAQGSGFQQLLRSQPGSLTVCLTTVINQKSLLILARR